MKVFKLTATEMLPCWRYCRRAKHEPDGSSVKIERTDIGIFDSLAKAESLMREYGTLHGADHLVFGFIYYKGEPWEHDYHGDMFRTYPTDAGALDYKSDARGPIQRLRTLAYLMCKGDGDEA